MSVLDRLARFVTQRRRTTAVLLLVATLLATWGHLYEPPAQQPENAEAPSGSGERLRVATDDFQRRTADCFLVVETEDLFTPAATAAVRHMVAAVEQLPYVDSITWVDTVPVLNIFGLREPLLPPNDASPERFRDTRERVLQHPLVAGQLLSDDGRTLLMPIAFDWLDVTSDEDCSSAILQVARSAAAESAGVPLRVRLTGRVPLYLAHREAFHRNQMKFQAIAYGLVLLLALILFRGVRAVLTVALAPALGVYWTMGLLNWLDELSNPLTSVVLPVLLVMVGLTDGVHLMVQIRRGRVEGLPPDQAAARALRQVGLACLLTSLTTAIGFASLLLAHSEFVRGFGRGCFCGVVLTFFAVIITIPLVSSTRFGRTLHHGHEHDLVGRGLRRSGWIIAGVLRHARAVTAVAIVSTVALTWVALTLRPDDRMRDSQPTGSEAYQALAHCDRALGGIEMIRVVATWSEPRQNQQQVLDVIDRIERVLDGEDLIRHPLSILSILAALPGEAPATERMSLLELLPSRVKSTYLDDSARKAVVTARIQDLGIARYEPVFRRVEQQLAGLSGEFPGFEFELAGEPVTRGRNLHRIVTDLASSLGTAALIIFVVMALAYRSVRLGLITIIPNLFPLVATGAMMVWLDHPLEIASVCSFTVCLGIAVDDTIHFLTRFQEEMRSEADVSAALARSFMDVGSAMVITTTILVTGFGTVLTSDLPGHRYFAAMAVSTISAALIGDLIFLPALLATFSGRKKQQPSTSTPAEVANVRSSPTQQAADSAELVDQRQG